MTIIAEAQAIENARRKTVHYREDPRGFATERRPARFPPPTPTMWTEPCVVSGDKRLMFTEHYAAPGPRRHGRMTNVAYLTLVDALESVATLSNPDDPRCDVPSEAREAARIYVESWIKAPLEALKDYIEGDNGAISDWEQGH